MDLFSESIEPAESIVQLAEGAYWLRGFALPVANALCNLLLAHFKQFPPQQMMTPMGYPMSVKTTSFGAFGWVGTTQGYGYSTVDLVTQQPWPLIPDALLQLAQDAALQSGYKDFVPDTCLVNVYAVGTKMGLHRDRDERDFNQPIVSVSLGLPATFQFGGLKRTDKCQKIPLLHGDVVVWGGKTRLSYHGIMPLKSNIHKDLGVFRINLTFRKAR
jgi:alkylated DNA repair protein (DNA oxidative demethylase)